REWRAAPRPELLCQEIHGQIFTPPHHRRYRSQSAAGSPAGLCRGDRAGRWLLTAPSRNERGPLTRGIQVSLTFAMMVRHSSSEKNGPPAGIFLSLNAYQPDSGSLCMSSSPGATNRAVRLHSDAVLPFDVLNRKYSITTLNMHP